MINKIDKTDSSYEITRKVIAKIGRFGLGVAITGATLSGVGAGVNYLPFDLGKFKWVRGLSYAGGSIASTVISHKVGPIMEEKTGELVDDIADAVNETIDQLNSDISE